MIESNRIDQRNTQSTKQGLSPNSFEARNGNVNGSHKLPTIIKKACRNLARTARNSGCIRFNEWRNFQEDERFGIFCVILEPAKLYTKMFSVWIGHEETDHECQSNGLAKGELFINQQAFWSAQVNINYFGRHISCIKYTEKMDKHAKFVWINWKHLFPFQTESATVNLTRFKHVESQDPPWHLQACSQRLRWSSWELSINSSVYTQNVLKARSSEHQIPPHPLLFCQSFKNPSICSSSR